MMIASATSERTSSVTYAGRPEVTAKDKASLFWLERIDELS